MKSRLQPSTPEERARRHRAAILEEVEQWRDRSEDDRARALAELLDLADAIIAGGDNPARMRRWQDPRSEESLACWRELMRRHRSA